MDNDCKETLAIRHLLLEISIENVLTDSRAVRSMIGIYIDYEGLYDLRCQRQVRGYDYANS